MPRGKSRGRMSRSSTKKRGGRGRKDRNLKEGFFHDISTDRGMGNMKEDEY